LGGKIGHWVPKQISSSAHCSRTPSPSLASSNPHPRFSSHPVSGFTPQQIAESWTLFFLCLILDDTLILIPSLFLSPRRKPRPQYLLWGERKKELSILRVSTSCPRWYFKNKLGSIYPNNFKLCIRTSQSSTYPSF
jgi:hypothetical protein